MTMQALTLPLTLLMARSLSVESHAATHRDGLAGHVGIVDEHHDGFGDFVGCSETTERYPLDERPLAFHHLGFDQGRRNGIHRNSFFDEARCVAARQSLKSCFGCVVVGSDRASPPSGT